VSGHQKTMLALIFIVVLYGFFHFGLAADSWAVTAVQAVILAALLFLLITPFETEIKTEVESSKDSGEREKISGQDLERNGKELEIIKELSDSFYVKNRVDAEKDFTLFLSKILTIIKKTFAARTAAIIFLDEHVNKASVRSIVSDDENIDKNASCEPGKGVIGKVLEKKTSFLTNKIDDAGEELPYYRDAGAAVSALASPIFIENEIVGVLTIDSREQNAFNQDDIQLFETYSGVVSEIVINYHNLFEFENSARLFSSFYEVSRGLNSNLKFDEILDLLLSIVKRVFQYERITIVSFQTGHEQAEIIRVVGQVDDFPEGMKFPLDEGLTGLVMRKRKVLRVADMEKGEYFMARYHNQEKTNYGLRSFLAAPISYHDFCFGAISIECKRPNQYSERHERILLMLANNFGVALERSYVLEQLESLATTDGLTKLYNYRSFSQRLNEEIERALRYNMKFSLLILDLDHFKKVNDTYGHLAGDLVLKKIADTIRASTRAIDFIARYGGEEFAVILIEASLNDSLISAERIRENVENLDITYKDKKINITVSIGAVEFFEHPRDPQELITRADNALYRAKAGGRNRIEAYQEEQSYSRKES